MGLPVMAHAPHGPATAAADASGEAPRKMPGHVPAAGAEFLLTKTGDYRLTEVLPIEPRWIELPHAPESTRCLAMIPGEVLSTPLLVAAEEAAAWLKIARGLPQISGDGLEAEVWLCPEDAAPSRLFCWRLDNDSPRAGKASVVLPLPIATGRRFRLELRCGAGPEGDPSADWLGVVEWAVSSELRLPLLRARSHAEWRLQNELAHFENAYRGEIYRHREVTRRDDAIVEIRDLPIQAAILPGIDVASLMARAELVAPTPGESSYVYSHRLMFGLLDQQRPQFANRLAEMHARLDRPLRMLSLCAGEAKVEADIFARAGVPVELVLVDVNERLLQRAARSMPRGVRIECLRGSATDISPAMGQFDVINITSGLHHLVELEQVLAAVATMLAPEGEFWLIGEQVGRNGNRLWPDARAAADLVFSAWPEAKRRNAGTGRIDEHVPDTDCASGTFEGIRSEDIEVEVARHFLPLCVVLADAFLWRLMDGTYAPNFDLSHPQDLALVRAAVVAEVRHWFEGGRGTALHGAYRAKRGRPPA
jgi:SAM-dependent methyltransferase